MTLGASRATSVRLRADRWVLRVAILRACFLLMRNAFCPQPPSRDSVEGSEADLLLGGSPRSDRTFMSTRDKVGGAVGGMVGGGGTLRNGTLDASVLGQ